MNIKVIWSKCNCVHFVVLLLISWESTPALPLGRKCVGRSWDFLKNANTHFFPTQYIHCNCSKKKILFFFSQSLVKSIHLHIVFPILSFPTAKWSRANEYLVHKRANVVLGNIRCEIIIKINPFLDQNFMNECTRGRLTSRSLCCFLLPEHIWSKRGLDGLNVFLRARSCQTFWRARLIARRLPGLFVWNISNKELVAHCHLQLKTTQVKKSHSEHSEFHIYTFIFAFVAYI